MEEASNAECISSPFLFSLLPPFRGFLELDISGVKHQTELIKEQDKKNYSHSFEKNSTVNPPSRGFLLSFPPLPS